MALAPFVLAAVWVLVSLLVIFHQVASSIAPSSKTMGLTSPNLRGFDPEYPFNNVMSSFFPIDATIEYNTSENETATLLSRYASFSSIIETSLSSKFIVFPDNGCAINLNSTHDIAEYEGKIIVIQRGDCTFVDKIRNILDSGMNPSGIIVGNDDPRTGLITMYSGSFNMDGEVRIPLLFITFEDYQLLRSLSSNKNLTLTIFTASIGSWLNLVLSMTLSPPLLIILFYFMLKVYQRVRHKQQCRSNVKLVNNLTVYVYNTGYLVPLTSFKEYLRLTNQQEAKHISVEDLNSSEALLQDLSKPNSSTSLTGNRLVANGVSLDKYPQLKLLTTPGDYFATYKCLICLDKFYELESRVLVLQCKHMFHQRCLSNWLVNFKRSCPLCNASFRSKRSETNVGGQLQETVEQPLVEATLVTRPFSEYGTIDLEWQSGSREEGSDYELLPIGNSTFLEEEEIGNSSVAAGMPSNNSMLSSQSFFSTNSNPGYSTYGQNSSSRYSNPDQGNSVPDQNPRSWNSVAGSSESQSSYNTAESTPTSMQLGSAYSHFTDAGSEFQESSSTTTNASDMTLEAQEEGRRN